jgi:peptidoglycan/xylan/chitin deacetylase (PgdA/CDA1 family)
MLVLMGRLYRGIGIPVLLYHSIDSSGSVISIEPKEFRAQMECLKYNGYQTISLPKFLEYLRVDGAPPARMVVLTFDDGFRNNYTEAFPILQAHGFTATIFLTTDYINRVCSWEKHDLIPELPLLSWEEIREMSAYGIHFGSHSCTHPYLTRISEEELKTELLNSKSTIEARVNKPVTFFCHPYGDTNRGTQRAAQECGYWGAFGGLDFSLANSKDERYNLKRVGTGHFSSLQDFEAGLLGTYNWYIRLKTLSLKS